MQQLRRISAIVLSLLLITGSLTVPQPGLAKAAPDAVTELTFTIMHTNDEHSVLLPLPLIDFDPTSNSGSGGGFARLASAVNTIRANKRATGEPVLLVSAGDYLSGSPFAWLALERQAAELSLMLSLGYDAITIGNHEFDYGADVLAAYFRAAGYPRVGKTTPIVASNTVIPEGHALGEAGIQKTAIKTLANGLQVGFFGLLGKDAIEYTPYAAPISFSEQQAAAGAAVAALEAAGAEVIVAISHAGPVEDGLLAKSVPGIDIIIGGHSHEALQQPIVIGKTIIVQAGTQLSHLGLLELTYNRETDTIRLRNETNRQPYLLPLTADVACDAIYANKVARLTDDLNALLARLTDNRFSDMSQAVLHTNFAVKNEPKLAETPFGDFVTDAMRMIGEQVTGDKVDFAFQANGVIRGGLEPGTLPGREGQIALFDLVNTVGLGLGPDGEPGYPLVSIYFTGEEVRRILEITALLPQLKGDPFFLQMSGLRMQYDPARAILAWIPVKKIPIPTTRAVVQAERYTGSGLQQDNNEWAPLERGDKELYHVVSDHYLAAFLPMVGELLPSLGLVMKDKQGNPVDVNDCIVYRDGREFKVWQAVLEYAASQTPVSAGGLLELPTYYAQTTGRIVPVRTLPIWLWPAVGIVVLVLLLVFLLRRWRQRRRAAHA